MDPTAPPFTQPLAAAHSSGSSAMPTPPPAGASAEVLFGGAATPHLASATSSVPAGRPGCFPHAPLSVPGGMAPRTPPRGGAPGAGPSGTPQHAASRPAGAPIEYSPMGPTVFVGGDPYPLLEDRRFSVGTYFPDGTVLYDIIFSPPREIPMSVAEGEGGITAVKLQPGAQYVANRSVHPQCIVLHNLHARATSKELGQWFETQLEGCSVYEADVYRWPGEKRQNKSRGYVLLWSQQHTQMFLEQKFFPSNVTPMWRFQLEAMDWRGPMQTAPSPGLGGTGVRPAPGGGPMQQLVGPAAGAGVATPPAGPAGQSQQQHLFAGRGGSGSAVSVAFLDNSDVISMMGAGPACGAGAAAPPGHFEQVAFGGNFSYGPGIGGQSDVVAGAHVPLSFVAVCLGDAAVSVAVKRSAFGCSPVTAAALTDAGGVTNAPVSIIAFCPQRGGVVGVGRFRGAVPPGNKAAASVAGPGEVEVRIQWQALCGDAAVAAVEIDAAAPGLNVAAGMADGATVPPEAGRVILELVTAKSHNAVAAGQQTGGAEMNRNKFPIVAGSPPSGAAAGPLPPQGYAKVVAQAAKVVESASANNEDSKSIGGRDWPVKRGGGGGGGGGGGASSSPQPKGSGREARAKPSGGTAGAVVSTEKPKSAKGDAKADGRSGQRGQGRTGAALSGAGASSSPTATDGRKSTGSRRGGGAPK